MKINLPFLKKPTANAVQEAVNSAEAPPMTLRAEPQVKSINKTGKYIAIALGAVIVGSLSITPMLKKQHSNEAATAKQAEEEEARKREMLEKQELVKTPDGRVVAPLLARAPRGILTEKDAPVEIPLVQNSTVGLIAPATQGLINSAPAQQINQVQPIDPEVERMKLIKEQNRQREMQAYLAPAGASNITAPAASATPQAPGLPFGSAGGVAPAQPDVVAQALAAAAAQDQNRQAQKASFINGFQQVNPADTNYLKQGVTAPLSRFELKAGTVIPGVMISGLNSDLPGNIIGQVREDVYDSVRGDSVLIPRGTKVFGAYDSGVAFGQDRALVVWNRLIFPDGSSLNLQGMQGSDNAGYSGFKDQVNNHYTRIIGGALIFSLFTAQIQQSQPNTGGNNLSAQQSFGAALGQTLGQFGTETGRKLLQLQPTIEVRPGYTFSIMVNKDVAFAGPYKK